MCHCLIKMFIADAQLVHNLCVTDGVTWHKLCLIFHDDKCHAPMQILPDATMQMFVTKIHPRVRLAYVIFSTITILHARCPDHPHSELVCPFSTN